MVHKFERVFRDRHLELEQAAQDAGLRQKLTEEFPPKSARVLDRLVGLPTKDDLEELQRATTEITTAEDKYVYFLLATASAALFVALQRTSAVGFQESQVLLAFAGACWIGSFISGCLNRVFEISKTKNKFFADAISLVRPVARLEAEEKNIEGAKLEQALEMIDSLAEDISSASDTAHDMARACYRFQILLLILGGGFFIGWHLYDMWLRT